MHTDGVTNPLPPISQLLNEVAEALRSSSRIEPIDLDIVALTKPLQSLTNNLLYTDGGQHKFSLLSRTEEPVIPWVAQRMKPAAPKNLEQVRALHERREQVAEDFLSVWNGTHGTPSPDNSNDHKNAASDWTSLGLTSSPSSSTAKPVDAIICPVAPHPTPPIDRWNATGYTAMWVLLDYPAGVLPIRPLSVADTQLELPPQTTTAPSGSWDRENRKLWDAVDRGVYVDSPLSVQVVVPRLQEGKLVRVMRALEGALRPLREKSGGAGGGAGGEKAAGRAKL